MAQCLLILLPLQQQLSQLNLLTHSSSSPPLPHHRGRTGLTLSASPFRLRLGLGKKSQLNAAPGTVLGVEPDIVEDLVDGWDYKTAGEDEEEEFFPYGKADGSHTWHEGDDNVEFIDYVRDQIVEAGGPNDHPGQATISWLFLPAIFSGMAFGVQHEYLFLAGVLFIFAFIGIEMTKPNKASNFEYDKNIPNSKFEP